ncbi:hypothetical protein GBAR_LOCUS14303, partial [Geodia barretti]
MDVLLDSGDVIVSEWSSPDLVDCLCQALEQATSVSTLDSAGVYIQCLHTMTTHENGISSL